MQVTINGQIETIEPGFTVGDFLASRRLDPKRVAVEINEDLVPRRTFPQASIHEGDRLEIVTFVGGG